MRGVLEQVVAEKIDDGEKEKKKKRRSGRRPKQNNSSSVSCSSVNEMRGEASNCLGNDRATTHVTTSLKQQNLETCPSGEQELTKASYVAFNSMPPMHIDEHANSEDIQSLRDRNPHSSDPDGRMFSKSCPESIAYGGSSDSFINGDFPHPHWMAGYAPKKYFAPHWSLQAVNDALEKGDVFKAIFRVNAYNRLEAYCQIDGVPTDVLINGIPSQNRAVEGDIVAVKVEPLSLWTRMKGLTGNCNNSRPVVDFSVLPKESDFAGNNCKGKNKADVDYEYANHKSNLFPEKESSSEKNTSLCGPIHLEPMGPSSYDQVDGSHLSASESSRVGSYTEQVYAKNAVERMCDMISSYPSRRPTGRVLAVIEGSPRRDAIVGFLNIKQWFSYWEFFTKDGNKSASVCTDRGYIELAPTDPKFPKMMVPVQGLPDPVKRRLGNGDATLEMELVAAKIVNWGEESLLPQASILHTFGRGGEIESQLNAILFENSICLSEFSPDSLSCLPNLPWEIPLEELQSRKDLRNLCLFTIDPSTATDLDDALSVENLPNGIYRVGIHIADVSYFVLPDTELDKEAQIRSTSIYMLQKKIPMLPPLLSENIGSLNPGVDRLAFSVFLDLNLAGDIIDQWIGRTVIRSCCKLSYEHAQDVIDGSTNLGSADFLGDGYPQLHGHFEWFDVIRSIRDLYQLSNILRDKRFNDGALGLESAKIAFLFDEYGIPYDSRLCERKGSNFLVEEFMLLANRTAAETISRAFPDTALLRRHPEPNMRKLKNFEAFCIKHGLELDASSSGKFHLSLQKIREKLKDDSSLFDILINYAARPMQLATYFCSGDLKDNEKDWGHYALAAPLYTHFTSPLRRYPDIVVHRTLAAVIDAEDLYLSRQKTLYNLQRGEEVTRKCFSGVYFEKNAAESLEGREALSAAALKHRVPDVELLADVAAYCNGRKLASRRVKDACDKLYMWAWLKKKEILFSEARVLGVGPRFMSVYIQKLAIERQIYYDEVESLIVEWLDATSTLVFNLFPNRRPFRRGSPGKWRPLEDTALVVSPCDLNEHDAVDEDVLSTIISNNGSSEVEIEPAVFPLTVHRLSTIPVALHAIGGDDGPLEIGVRLYMSSYFR